MSAICPRRCGAGAAVLALGCVSCVGQAPAEPDPSGFDLSRAEVIDLSHPYDEDSLFWPTSPTTFELTSLAFGPSAGGYFYAANSFCTPEHGGTHIDAPIHFSEQGWTLGEVPVERLIAPGVVIDVSAQAVQNRDYRLTVEDVRMWERDHGDIPAGSIVLLRTGWSSRWPDATAYLGDETPGDATNFIFRHTASKRPACWSGSVASRPWVSIPPASTTDRRPTSSCTRSPPAANVVGLENLTNVDDLPAVGAWVVALPMKIRDGTGGPVRVVALREPM